ncbi:helix-hairpin-helix domain-containing protein [Aeromonas simiae]|uniref:helix-hairpin-helix domain-containing protein n=1 Tax=Aeromonas simiae TaxID=218936 RepID=UPI0005AAB00C|nr:helix-hairpin-helix domain-containing protein [Aeromonas simiae]
MGFSSSERTALLSLKGVGPTVLTRLEAVGIDSLAILAQSEADELLRTLSLMLGSTCWRNSPQAHAAITAAIALARQHGEERPR